MFTMQKTLRKNLGRYIALKIEVFCYIEISEKGYLQERFRSPHLRSGDPVAQLSLAHGKMCAEKG